MKRIVICADGTWNEPETKSKDSGRPQPTNVLKVARAVLPRADDGVDQLVYYHVGVGTEGGLDTFTGGAFGHGMAQNVRSLYRFIVFNYQPGDQLYFFGFSRGAFTVRTLAGFMNRVGLLEKDDEYYTPEMYGLYQSRIPVDSPKWANAFRNVKPRECPPIHFVGVWDTVGALGAPGILGQIFNPNKYKYHDIGLNPHIRNAYQALAIDERRKPFLPSLWERPVDWDGQLQQVWFPGVHSNVGGGYSPDGLANEALQWMAEKAEACDLQFDRNYLKHYKPCFNSVLNDSMTSMYRLMGPEVRQLGSDKTREEKIHQSAVDRVQLPACQYAPDNLTQRMKRGDLAVVDTHGIERGKPC